MYDSLKTDAEWGKEGGMTFWWLERRFLDAKVE